jgi:hypothetical protein
MLAFAPANMAKIGAKREDIVFMNLFVLHSCCFVRAATDVVLSVFVSRTLEGRKFAEIV